MIPLMHPPAAAFSRAQHVKEQDVDGDALVCSLTACGRATVQSKFSPTRLRLLLSLLRTHTVYMSMTMMELRAI